MSQDQIVKDATLLGEVQMPAIEFEINIQVSKNEIKQFTVHKNFKISRVKQLLVNLESHESIDNIALKNKDTTLSNEV